MSALPLYAVCKRVGCDRIRRVATPAEQRPRRYCSARCEQLAREAFRRGGAKGGRISGAKRTASLLARIQGLSPTEAYHLGYQCGQDAADKRAKRKGLAA